MKNRVLSLFLALVLCLSLLCPAAYAVADGSEEEVLRLSSAEDLRAFSSSCMLDEFSVGLRVELTCDIDLEDEPFSPIPSFSGIFDGGGHTISGFLLATDGSHQGLFRYLQQGGEIHDLKVEGRVEPGRSRSYVGGLVGLNHGLISNCSFSGHVSGLNYVGGIAGESDGQISSCRFSGVVSGKRFTGGIAGMSTGVVDGCANAADVNTSISEGGLEFDQLDLGSVSGFNLTSAEDADVVSDSGGIVGFSSGFIGNCKNTGAIGYPHYGYNTGGIAGRQSGCIYKCENLGSVYGRKDAAGIVGQMEPYLLLKDTESLAEEIMLLQALIDAALANSGMLSDDLVDALRGINDSASATLGGLLPGGDYPSLDPGDLPDLPIHTPLPTEPPEPAPAEPESTSEPAANAAPAERAEPPASAQSAVESPSLRAFSAPARRLGRLRSPLRRLSSEQPTTPSINYDSLTENRAAMETELNNLTNVMSWSAGVITSDLRSISAQMSKVMLMMTNLLSGNTELNIYEDVSGEEPADSIQGRVYACVNHGHIEADANVGGIAGDMGIEYEFDLENELMSAINSRNPITSTYLTKCISSGNINHGSIAGKKDNVGGIAGQAQVGIIEHCENYGRVESSEGNYVGGIAGISHTNIRLCYSMCQLDGREFVGGIAGRAVELHDCVSLVGADDVTACFGAVAGYAEIAQAEDGEDLVSGNIFVGEGIGAIDGISYSGRAEPVSYEQMLQREELPQSFGKLRLSFVADGELIDELFFDYGGSVSPTQLPEVPEKPGYTAAWSAYDYNDLRFSATIEAVYTPLHAALASDLTRDGSPLSIVLVEGEFEDSVKLRLAPYSGEGPDAELGHTLEQWALTLDGAGHTTYGVRYLEPEHTLKNSVIDIYVYNGKIWQKVSSSDNGSYLVFDAENNPLVFCAVEHKNAAKVGALIAAACALVMLVLLVILIKHLRRKKTVFLSSGSHAPEEERTP